MIWDKTHVERAKAEGWQLATVIDNGTTHPYYMVAPAQQSALATNQLAAHHVLNMARTGSLLHRHALQIMASSRIKQPKKGTRK